MNNYGKFFVEFLTPFFDGLLSIFKSIFAGIVEMFNIVKYIETITKYKGSVNTVFVIIAIICLILLICLFVALVYYIIKRIIKIVRKSHEQDALLEEVEKLNYDVIKLRQENDKLMAMAASGEGNLDENGNPTTQIEEGESRFYKLSAIDAKFADYQDTTEWDNSLTLKDVCDNFRNYSASRLG